MLSGHNCVPADTRLPPIFQALAAELASDWQFPFVIHNEYEVSILLQPVELVCGSLLQIVALFSLRTSWLGEVLPPDSQWRDNFKLDLNMKFSTSFR